MQIETEMIDYMLRDGIPEGRVAEIMDTALWRVQARGRAMRRRPKTDEQRARHLEACRKHREVARVRMAEIRERYRETAR